MNCFIISHDKRSSQAQQFYRHWDQMENVGMQLMVDVLFLDRLHAALTQTQNMLIEALAKQQLAKDAVAQKFRLVQKSLSPLCIQILVLQNAPIVQH